MQSIAFGDRAKGETQTVAQAHLEGNWSYAKAVKSASSLKPTSSQTLVAMRAADASYRATFGKAQQTGVRPDDRSGSRGV